MPSPVWHAISPSPTPFWEGGSEEGNLACVTVFTAVARSHVQAQAGGSAPLPSPVGTVDDLVYAESTDEEEVKVDDE